MSTITLTQAQLQEIINNAVTAALDTSAPAKSPKPEKVTPEWIVARAKNRDYNRQTAAWLREKNLPTNGPVWEAAKAGERSVAKLRKLAK